jgi:hypothetical protein
VFAVACSLLSFHMQIGWRMGAQHHERMAAFAEDARRGATPEAIAAAHGPLGLHDDRAFLVERLRQMKRCGIAPFPRKAR